LKRSNDTFVALVLASYNNVALGSAVVCINPPNNRAFFLLIAVQISFPDIESRWHSSCHCRHGSEFNL